MTIVFEGTKSDLHISKDTYFRNVTLKFHKKIAKIVDSCLKVSEL